MKCKLLEIKSKKHLGLFRSLNLTIFRIVRRNQINPDLKNVLNP